jgi:3-oxoacyl-[acyl-carrier protein] reductase
MDLGLKGRRALVTGASAGLGAAAAMALAAEGVELAICSRSLKRLGIAAEKIYKATGIQARLLEGDISKEDDVHRVVAEAGEVDILISNGGGPPPGQLTEHDAAKWQEAANLVLRPAITLTRDVIDGMVERKWGRLIYITSVGVLQPIDNLILSNTYRAGVTGFCKTVSNNYAKYGITANCVCPGYTATERLENLAKDQAAKSDQTYQQVMKQFASLSPAGRVGKPEELAALIAFLASERAAYITGTSIPIDGGLAKALI